MRETGKLKQIEGIDDVNMIKLLVSKLGIGNYI